MLKDVKRRLLSFPDTYLLLEMRQATPERGRAVRLCLARKIPRPLTVRERVRRISLTKSGHFRAVLPAVVCPADRSGKQMFFWTPPQH